MSHAGPSGTKSCVYHVVFTCQMLIWAGFRPHPVDLRVSRPD